MNEAKYPRVLGANTIGAASEVGIQPASEVAEQLAGVDLALTELHDHLSMLEKRLAPVLRDIPLGDNTQQPTCARPMCQVADHVFGHRSSVASATDRLMHLLDRLGI